MKENDDNVDNDTRYRFTTVSIKRCRLSACNFWNINFTVKYYRNVYDSKVKRGKDIWPARW